MTDEGPIQVGSMLFTLVEPHAGHEVSYNRWYERDHFYGGCMVGPYNFAGRRWVATRRLKALRYPDPSPLTGEAEKGSYLALYWVLAGHHEDWNRWAYRELKKLHADGRMFSHRDHVHTLLYTFDSATYRDADPVPAALALDHPFAGLAVVIGQATNGREELDAWYAEQPLPPGAALRLDWSPLPLQVDAPGVAKDEGDARRFAHLYFLDTDPERVWADGFGDHGQALADSGHGEVLWAGAFIPTIPGTDRYTDEL